MRPPVPLAAYTPQSVQSRKSPPHFFQTLQTAYSRDFRQRRWPYKPLPAIQLVEDLAEFSNFVAPRAERKFRRNNHVLVVFERGNRGPQQLQRRRPRPSGRSPPLGDGLVHESGKLATSGVRFQLYCQNLHEFPRECLKPDASQRLSPVKAWFWHKCRHSRGALLTNKLLTNANRPAVRSC